MLAAGIARYIIYTFNLVLVVFGALMIIFGLLPIVRDGYDSSYSVISISIGVVVFLIAFFGCCGAVRQNRTLLTAHAAILLSLFITQIIVAILVAIAIGNGTFDDMQGFLKGFFNATSPDYKFNNIQLQLHCCGVNNYTDYGSNPIPGSCCGERSDVDDFNQPSCEVGYAFKTGCAGKLSSCIEDNYRWISGIAIGFGVLELCGAVFTFWTRDHLKRH
ncbi:hypothetical protein HHI36_008666 [Cryptolaemus montrouzieri]|uniref:Tetraspanin n=1 Tax=Cryptolaemus montrouzieri TaxID=559131 RepID=A0ABD2MTN2_9CUCU